MLAMKALRGAGYSDPGSSNAAVEVPVVSAVTTTAEAEAAAAVLLLGIAAVVGEEEDSPGC